MKQTYFIHNQQAGPVYIFTVAFQSLFTVWSSVSSDVSIASLKLLFRAVLHLRSHFYDLYFLLCLYKVVA